MDFLEDHLAALPALHAGALRWFIARRSMTVEWSTIMAVSPVLVANRAKGIFKPHQLDYAISVKQTSQGTYEDGSVEELPDGTWRYEYRAEAPHASGKETAQVKALLRAWNDRVPVGVLIQSGARRSPYHVHGLALIEHYDAQERMFTFRGFDDNGVIESMDTDDLDRSLAAVASSLADVAPIAAFEFVMRQVRARRGQSKFRAALFDAYGSACAMTRCDAAPALEAAHIEPVAAGGLHAVTNGMLLRADIHTLFDLHHLGVHPDTYRVAVASNLRMTVYDGLDGVAITLPADASAGPDPVLLASHFQHVVAP